MADQQKVTHYLYSKVTRMWLGVGSREEADKWYPRWVALHGEENVTIFEAEVFAEMYRTGQV